MGAAIRKSSEWRSYKPSKSGSGAASKIQVKVLDNKYKDVQAFWVGSKQTGVDANGNASFAWDQVKEANQNVVLKLGENDIGEILSVINRQKDKAELFHKNANGSTTFQFVRMVNDQKVVSYHVRLAKKGKDGALIEVKHGLSVGEIEILRILLGDIIRLDYGWQFTDYTQPEVS